MFTQIQLKNFKSWKDTGRVRLAPVTAFFGTNSSGKTSLLQSLLLMKQTADSADRNRIFTTGGPTSLVDLGTYSDLIHNHHESSPVALSLRWQGADDSLTVLDPIKRARKVASVQLQSDRFGIDVEAYLGSRDSHVERLDYWLGDARFTLARENDGYFLDSPDYSFLRTTGRPWPLPAPAKFYSFPEQVRLYFQNAAFLTDLELGLETALGRLKYLGPLRQDPQRQYIFSGGEPDDVGPAGVNSRLMHS